MLLQPLTKTKTTREELTILRIKCGEWPGSVRNNIRGLHCRLHGLIEKSAPILLQSEIPVEKKKKKS
jgi:hypothetical protein